MSRFQKILAGLLFLQLVLTVAVFWPQQQAEAVDEPLLAAVATEDVTEVTITGAEGETVTLAREGDGWVLASRADYPALATNVDGLLEKLTDAQTGRLVTTTAASHDRLQIADDNFVRRIELALADGTTHTLYLGSAANAQAAHVRRAGEDDVYLATGLTARDAGTAASNWIDTGYVSLPADTLTAVTVENDNGTFEFRKEDDGEWVYAGLAEGETYAPVTFNTILSRLGNLTLSEPLGTEAEAAYGLDQPLATVTVTIESDEATGTHTLLIGARDEDSDTYVVKSSAADYYVRVSGFNVQEMVELTHEDLLQSAEATPEAGTNGAGESTVPDAGGGSE